MNINSDSFQLSFNSKIFDYENKTKNIIITDIYRRFLYDKLKNHFSVIYKKYVDDIKISNININVHDRTNFLSFVFGIDFISLFIFSHNFNSNFDPIFDSVSPFSIDNIVDYIENKNCIITINKNIKKCILDIFPQLSDLYIQCFNDLVNNIHLIDKIKYIINYKIFKQSVIIFLDVSEIPNLPLYYERKLILSLHMFNHLVRLFNTNFLDDHESRDIKDEKVIEYIYIIFNRYNTFSSGNNQASILPSFKKLLKNQLNIKIELFGSPINTSNFRFGSFFFDCDKYFGSLGNFFDLNIEKGYYEINPPFDSCLIKKMFDKSLSLLINAQNNKNPLLFCFIIPSSYFKNSQLSDDFNPFIKLFYLADKNKFPYMRYDRNYSKTLVTPITNTYIIICHTDYVSKYVSILSKKFGKSIDIWFNKFEQNSSINPIHSPDISS